ncbi:hypothetical protein DFQ27_004109 [Actinomortierella ambigua]|uniref:MFS general substrate transporter n=1 Tax=Actinomortierella ambigua TaxID=1343610 RepID=A0A9P6Q2R4_9FUNG|nr:hypothetical protein DFQ26_008285 [Actinomortierella ambigua]KAG0259338.1 hypothetical protein DFQ27_004109 [Actinomortierella ambigua]
MGLRWNSPLAQVLAVGFICFCCPGLYNALNSMGGGGQVDSKVGQNANVALYTTFCIFGLLAGAIHNLLGPKWTILLGCAAYCLYVGSLLAYNHIQNAAFTVACGGILGAGAGLLWTAQGAMMMAYPREEEKGKYIGYFWAIFNMGGVLGSLISFGINFDNTPGPLGDTTYIVFLVLMCIGALIALSLANPRNVVHDNGDHIQIQAFPTWTGEVLAVFKLFLDWRMLVLTPMFLSSNWFYSYQFSTVNGAYFSMRTQALNSVFYWAAQIFGSWTFAKLLDAQQFHRRKRALLGLGVVTIAFVGTWTGGIFFQKTYTAKQVPPHDFEDMGADYAGPLILYMFYGLNDAAWQTYCYWLMGALSNDATVLSRYAGFYKCIQSAGAAISWRLNAIGIPFMTELIICYALLVVSVPGALFLAFRISDHSDEGAHEQSVEDRKAELELK